jgi:hypothetical protein
MVTNIEALSTWCQGHLHGAIDSIIFEAGFTSRVLVLRLRDGTEVIVKLRPFTRRLLGAARVHSRMWRSGFPCPEGCASSTLWFNLDQCQDTRAGWTGTDHDAAAPELYAALADMVARAPAVEDVPDLLPPPALAPLEPLGSSTVAATSGTAG